MDSIHKKATDSTPEMILDFETNSLLIKGESYPENAIKCYEEVFNALKEYLENMHDGTFTATFELIYFNSSSVKVLMNFFNLFDICAEKGNTINIIWCYQDGDDTIEEFGEDFSEDISNANFEMKMI